MMVATVHKESRAKAARQRRVFKMQSLRSGISPKVIGFSFLKCKASDRLQHRRLRRATRAG
jgi:hypothetical protein